jgi:hypothetical protein
MDYKIADEKTLNAIKEVLKCINLKYNNLTLKSHGLLKDEDLEWMINEENKILGRLGFKRLEDKKQEYVLVISFHNSLRKAAHYSTSIDYLMSIRYDYDGQSYSWVIKESNAIDLD